MANDGSEIIGLGHAGEAEIGALYLLQSHQRKGIGRGLLLRLLKTLKERCVAEARFDVLPANSNAIKFYRSLGAYLIERRTVSSPSGATEQLVFVIPTFRAR